MLTYAPKKFLDPGVSAQIQEHNEAYTLTSTVPEWWPSAIKKITALLSLPDNWDSYGAKSIDVNLAYASVNILQQISSIELPQPSIVPTTQGRLQFEWHTAGIRSEERRVGKECRSRWSPYH